MPRVTVCIPTYNRSQRLRPTVESVLGQTYADWELLIIDDGSRDDTLQVARSYEGDPRVRCIAKENGGHSSARNRGLEEARGAYIAYLDHDDRWLPGKLERQVAYLDAHPEFGLVYARFRLIDEGGVDQGVETWFEGEGDLFERLLNEGNFIRTMSLPLMRTELVRRTGGFQAVRDIVDDLDLFLRLSEHAPFGFIPEHLLDYNIGNGGQQTRDLFRGQLCHWGLIQHFSRDRRLSPEKGAALRKQWTAWYADTFRELGWKALRAADYPGARAFYRRAVQIRPALLADANFCKDLLALAKRSTLNRSSAL